MKIPAEALKKKGFTGDLITGEPLDRHCSIGVGGPAGLFAVPGSVDDIASLLVEVKDRNLPLCILGGGTNIIFGNGGYNGCVAHLGRAFAGITPNPDGSLHVGAATGTGKLLSYCRREGLSGLEFLAGIPGTVGGAVRMNAGVPGEEMAGLVRSANIFMGSAGHRLFTVDRRDLSFKYRELENLAPDDVITGVDLEVSSSSSEKVRSNIAERLARRTRTQPLALPSAGCWFKNPPGDSAGRLIDAAGLKGLRVGGAEVSEVHANFMVNRGQATAADFLTLTRRVRTTVKERFRVILEEEVHVY